MLPASEHSPAFVFPKCSGVVPVTDVYNKYIKYFLNLIGLDNKLYSSHKRCICNKDGGLHLNEPGLFQFKLALIHVISHCRNIFLYVYILFIYYIFSMF
jgi:hypothetical protein